MRSYTQMQDFVGRLTREETIAMIGVCLDALTAEDGATAVIDHFKANDNLDPLSVAVNDAQIELVEKENAAEGDG